mmetsp:Transcript_22379/g.26970  ORF Transcript_22379/g.26970 Transcript_22379/m.26970 type:complete len:215 (-) Transcript_22379:217-861(-)|eukprot:CAMPEP_0197846168 /NCGR_PEP_ID=MMETSP1438-20131217/2963_1 /TAXON_ID=1461541 /ORGANISM="Pterosperma sp., Strain CCMP1384" /LENGTH=214 /DNA_ID=CAMNT_0043457717 /DNA_START=113 /DNA_END=757 /DNA_ORIENTATION=+
MASTVDYHKCVSGLLAKADGRDKVMGAIQYVCLFLSEGQPGDTLNIMKNMGAARKPLRFYKPIELLLPLLVGPPAKGPAPLVVSGKVKSLALAMFFALDHVVWAGQAGIIKDKELLDKCQKMSFYGWMTGSSLTALELVAALQKDANNMSDEAKAKRQAQTLGVINASCQIAVAAGLLKLVDMKPRTIGAFGIATSALSIYGLLPPLPSKAKTA